MVPLPFSGLSLVIHLGIIAVAFVGRLFGIDRASTEGKTVKKSHKRIKSYIKPVISYITLIIIALITLAFMATALKTGYTSGANEPQRIFVSNLYHVVEHHGIEGLVEWHYVYRRPS